MAGTIILPRLDSTAAGRPTGARDGVIRGAGAAPVVPAIKDRFRMCFFPFPHAKRRHGPDCCRE
jgi:hypothetical protein